MKKLIKLLSAAALFIAMALPSVAANAAGTPVDLNPVQFTNLPPYMWWNNTVSNFTSNPLHIPKDTPVTIWLSFQGAMHTNATHACGEMVMTTNTLVTNVTVKFMLGRTISTNASSIGWATPNVDTTKGSIISFASAYQSATNKVCAYTNFAAATLAGAQYLIPYSITYPSSASNHVITNIIMFATYAR